MSTPWRSVLKLSSVTGAGIAGWFAGKHYERHVQPQQQGNDGRRGLLSGTNIRSMPGLPIFATVSAASPIVPAEGGDMGNKVSSAESRISQVSEEDERVAEDNLE